MIGSNSDITKQKRSELETERFREAVDNASEGFVLYDADERFVYANKRYREMFPQIGKTLKPGALREDIRQAYYSSGVFPVAVGRVDEFINEVRQRQIAGGSSELQLSNGTWFKFSDHVMLDGGIVSIRTDITDIKQREIEREANAKLYRSLIEDQPDFICRYTPDGTLLYANSAFAKEHGFSLDDLSSVNVFDFVLKADRNFAQEHIARFQPQQDFRRIEFQAIVADGSVRWQEWTDRAFFDDAGHLIELQAFGRDVTQRKRIEIELIESQQNLSNIMNNIADSVVTIDEAGKVLSFNSAAENSFGYSAEEIVGSQVEQLMPEPHKTSHAGYLRAYFQSGESAILGKGPRELEGLRKDGKKFPMELAISEMRLGERRVFIGAMRDISERKRIERDLLSSELRLSEAQRIAGLGNWVWDIATNNLSWSDGLYRIFGRQPQEFIESYPAFIAAIHPKDRARVEEGVQHTLESGEPYGIDHRVIWPDGTVHVVYERGEVEFDAAGNPARMSGTAQDITERKQIEEELHQAQKMKAVGQLTGGIAHDFNNLLAVMLGNLELLRDSVEIDGPAGEMIERGVKAAHRGAELTDRLLSFSRKQSLSPTTLNLNKIISNMIDLFRRTLSENIEVKFEESTELWLCNADQSQLENALLNLSINARDAMIDGGCITIETANVSLRDRIVAAQADVDPGRYVMLSVSDTGTGIADEELVHVFEPFFTTKEVGKGTGLGLSMVHGFAKQSGGSVTIESKLGAGTCIKLYLPSSAEKSDETILS